MDGIDISGAEKCMGVPVAAQPVGQADTCVAPHGIPLVLYQVAAHQPVPASESDHAYS